MGVYQERKGKTMIKNDNRDRDKRVNLRLSEKIGCLLEQQADENGMNMSAYISHLILQIEKQKENQAMLNNIINKMPQLDLQTMAKLMKNGGEKNES